MRRFGLVAIGVMLAAPFYLLLIDTTSLPELYVIPAVALLAGVAVLLGGGQGAVEITVPISAALAGWRALTRVPRDVAMVCRALVAQLRTRRPARGELRTVRFQGGDAGSDLGRAALTESLGSLAPNTIVVGVDLERNLLLVHQLHRSGGRTELDVLRLG